MDDPPALPAVASDSSLFFVCFGSTGFVVWVEEGEEEDCLGGWFLEAKGEPEKVGMDRPTGLETGDETCTTGTMNGYPGKFPAPTDSEMGRWRGR